MPPRSRTPRVSDRELEAVLRACRVLVAISVRSIASVEETVDVAQFRVLVIVADRKAVSLGELARAAGLTLSTASRLCDRLVSRGLLRRTEDPTNRRQIVLTLTPAGRAPVDAVTEQRREAVRAVLGGVPKALRMQLVEALQEFTAASGEVTETDLSAMGWGAESDDASPRARNGPNRNGKEVQR